MGNRRRSREIALQVLFQSEFEPDLTWERATALFTENFETPVEVKEYATSLLKGVWENKQQLDRLIQTHARNWQLDRMGFVDRNILRLAAFEMTLMNGEIPVKVIIDEAIEIGKRYGSEDTFAFVNGVLDNISKSLVK